MIKLKKSFQNMSQTSSSLNKVSFKSKFINNHKILGIISSKGLLKYICSEDNFIIDPSNYEITQDMNQPFNHYFINSSHNTYLTGKWNTYRIFCAKWITLKFIIIQFYNKRMLLLLC